VNRVFPYGRGNFKTCIFHRVPGSVLHFHTQVGR
jgi:hypothetical protein